MIDADDQETYSPTKPQNMSEMNPAFKTFNQKKDENGPLEKNDYNSTNLELLRHQILNSSYSKSQYMSNGRS